MADNQTIVPLTLDEYFESSHIGSIDRAIGNNIYGFNHRQVPGMVPMNKDSYGLTFFVRPQLNLQTDNIRNYRPFYNMLTENPVGIHRMVRCSLDPRLMNGYSTGTTAIAPIDCPIMDNQQAFIPILSNNLNSLSGWPDVVADYFTSKAGLYKEVYVQVDSTTKIYSSFDLECTFRNTKGDPIYYLQDVWVNYPSLVFENILVPYPDFIVENEIDYNTRVYRLVLDSEKRFVKKIAATGVSIPTTIPMGQFFDFTNERPYNDQAKDITIRFHSIGAQYNDPILVKEFNDTVGIFNPAMRLVNNTLFRTTSGMKQVPYYMLSLFKYRGYPRINPDNYELEWWVNEDLWIQKTAGMFSDLPPTAPPAPTPPPVPAT